MESSDHLTSPVPWYRYLVPSDAPGRQNRDLLTQYTDVQLRSGLIVCAITRDDTHIFALFPSYISFAKYSLSLPEARRCFFEIILGDQPQKTHLDIEVPRDKLPPGETDLVGFGSALIQAALEGVIQAYNQAYGRHLNVSTDVLILSSHGSDKQSFHLVVDNYAHLNHREARALYDLVIGCVEPEYHPYIDASVYSKTQQFRIIGSQKRGSGRIKTFMESHDYMGDRVDYTWREKPRQDGHRLSLMLEASLVTVTRHCTILPNLIPEEEVSASRWFQSGDVDDLAPETVQVAFDLLGSKAGVSVSAPNFPFEVRGVSGSIIMLKRRAPSRCQVCQRIHEHENPYIIVSTSETGARHVYFDCRRSSGQRLYLGIIDEEKNGAFLPDAPILVETSDILAKLAEMSQIPMKQIRHIKQASNKHV